MCLQANAALGLEEPAGLEVYQDPFLPENGGGVTSPLCHELQRSIVANGFSSALGP